MAKFQKGESGNRKGRKQGSRNKATLAALALLEGDLEIITKVCVDKAKDGDLMAVKLILDKVIPNAKERRLSIYLPQIEGTDNLPTALAEVLNAVASGELTPSEGQAITAMLETYRKGVELKDIEARVKALERGGRK